MEDINCTNRVSGPSVGQLVLRLVFASLTIYGGLLAHDRFMIMYTMQFVSIHFVAGVFLVSICSVWKEKLVPMQHWPTFHAVRFILMMLIVAVNYLYAIQLADCLSVLTGLFGEVCVEYCSRFFE